MDMDRRALLLYLERVRDLEVMKYYLGQQRDSELKQLDQEIAVAKTPLPPLTSSTQSDLEHDSDNSPTNWKLLILMIADVLVLLLGIFIIPNVFLCIFSVLFLIIIIIAGAIKSQTDQYHKDFKRKIEDQQRWTEEQQRRTASIPVLQKKRADRANYYKGRIAAVDQMCSMYYALNIIPKEFRKRDPIIYTYDFMSTSQFDLGYVLYHTHMEDGIQRITATINSESDRICREIRALNEATIRSNIDMLNKLDRSNSELRGIYSTMQSLENEFYHSSRNYF